MKNYVDENGVEIQHFYPTSYKLVKSGCCLEIYQFGKDILLGQKPKKRKGKKK